MINIEFYVSADGHLLGFGINGHSGYATQGNDIVCAAVSSAAIMTANIITDVLNLETELVTDDGNMSLKISPFDASKCRDTLLGFKLHMLQLEEQYSKFINVNYMEV